MDRLNTLLGVVTVIAALWVAAAWWRIWRREKPWRKRRAAEHQLSERATALAAHGVRERRGRGTGRLYLDR